MSKYRFGDRVLLKNGRTGVLIECDPNENGYYTVHIEGTTIYTIITENDIQWVL